MSLIACPECAARISDKARACPQCGHPINETGNRFLSEKNIGQIAGATGVWLTAPWIARMIFGVVFIIAVAAVLIFR